MIPCASAISYANEEREAVPGEPLPDVDILTCELPSGHKGPHSAGNQTWTRTDLEA